MALAIPTATRIVTLELLCTLWAEMGGMRYRFVQHDEHRNPPFRFRSRRRGLFKEGGRFASGRPSIRRLAYGKGADSRRLERLLGRARPSKHKRERRLSA